MIASSEASPSAETSRFNASLERGEESILAYRPQRWAARAAPSNPSHIEPFRGAITPTGENPRHATCALTTCAGRAKSFAHEHDQIDCQHIRRSPHFAGLSTSVRHFRLEG